MAKKQPAAAHDVTFTHDGEKWTHNLPEGHAGHAHAERIIANQKLLDDVHATSVHHEDMIVTPLGKGNGYGILEADHTAFSLDSDQRTIKGGISLTAQGLFPHAEPTEGMDADAKKGVKEYNAAQTYAARSTQKLGNGDYAVPDQVGEGEKAKTVLRKGKHSELKSELKEMDIIKAGRGGGRLGLYAGIAAAAVAVVGGALYFMHRRKQNKEAEVNTQDATVAAQSASVSKGGAALGY